MALLVSFLDTVSADNGLLAPTRADKPDGELQGSALSASSSYFNVCASDILPLCALVLLKLL